MQPQQFDAIIIGAGISGISAAYHLQKHCPNKTYAVLEQRQNLGGTWDLFNYPGIRSDSDMYTFGFSFYPWQDESAIAEKHKIIDYLQDTVQRFGIDQHIHYGLKTERAAWSTELAQWEVTAHEEVSGTKRLFQSQHIFMCTGYYNYEQAYTPHFPEQQRFKGEIVEPQFWPKDLNYKDKNIVVIGSGATAITLIPSLAKSAKKVTMLQRSPTYMGSKASKDPIANRLAKWFGRRAARWWFILSGMFTYAYCRWFPHHAKQKLVGDVEQLLGDNFSSDDFTPKYAPWDQRVCLCPDADFFDAIKLGKAQVVTDQIKSFTEQGIELDSGIELPADIIVAATGLDMLLFGGIELEIDGRTQQPADSYVYKGFMCSDVPNMYIGVGYTNASWTLKVDLTNRYACRLINYMQRHGHQYCVPTKTPDLVEAPLIDLSSGYIQRSLDKFPKQATKSPWKLHQNFILDNLLLRFAPLTDNAMQFGQADSTNSHL